MDLQIRKGTSADTEQMIALLQIVRQGMEQKEWLYLDEPDEVRQMMADGILEFWVAMDQEILSAAFYFLIPGLNSFNYGYDLGFHEDELRCVVNMDTIAVHPNYRGLGLQKRLMGEAEREVAQRGFRTLLCTVHPDNRFSLNNMLEQGYSIERKLAKYGSVRYVLRKNLK